MEDSAGAGFADGSGMQLRVARVCLDCEEVHDSAHCPVCASETFAFLSRWVPVQDRRTQPRPPQGATPAGRAGKMVLGAGLCGGAAYVLNRWLKNARQKIEDAAAAQPAGELR